MSQSKSELVIYGVKKFTRQISGERDTLHATFAHRLSEIPERIVSLERNAKAASFTLQALGKMPAISAVTGL